jgi:hypothetical protein
MALHWRGMKELWTLSRKDEAEIIHTRLAFLVSPLMTVT